MEKQYDKDFEVTVNGETFSVLADFRWEVEVVDYLFDNRSGKGADVTAEVPAEVTDCDIEPLPATAEELEAVKAEVLRVYAESDEGERNRETGKWL